MSTANYYREQARLLSRWADCAADPLTAQRLRARAGQLLSKACGAAESGGHNADVFDLFNAGQMFATPRERAQQK
jgi:hypothetical protein